MTTPRHRRTLGMGIVLVALVLSACTDAPDVIVPSDGPPSVASNIASVASATEAARTANEELQAVAAGRVENLDDRMLRLEVEVPGFGGFYYDSASQALAVYVRDEARGSRAAEAVRRVARSAAALASVADAPIQVRPANHAFSELVSWKKLLIGPLARLSNFLSIDADESRNRVVIEVADVAAQVEVERALSAAGIPESVFLVRPGVAFQSLQSNLTSYVRPTGGGSQISYYVGFQTGLCTLGWNTPALPSARGAS